jgi:hypothetical protein
MRGLPVRLYIFSSKHFAFKTMFVTIVLFCIYSIFIIKYKPNVILVQNQWQGNFVKSQEYLYDSNNIKYVLVGSSMSGRLDISIIKGKIYNLAFAGGSVLTGLQIIKNKGLMPEVIYIETNGIFTKKDNDFIDRLFTPVLYEIRRHLPSLQDKYQPFNLILSWLKSKQGLSDIQKMNMKPDPDVFNNSLSRFLKQHDKKIDTKKLKNELDELRNLIMYFNANGVKLVFYTMPVHPQIANSKMYKSANKFLADNFRDIGISWLSQPNNAKYETTDGIHLTYKSAVEFTKLFIQNIY